MTLSEEQQELRKRSIGGSDVGAILGESPFATAHDVWLDKTMDLAPWAGNASTHIGNLLEKPLVELVAKELGKLDELVTDEMIVDPSRPFHVNLDGRIGKEGIEAKWTTRPDDWGEEGSDDVPSIVTAQCQWAMMIAKLDRMRVVAAISQYQGPPAIRRFVLDPDPDLQHRLGVFMFGWWETYVSTKTPPPETPSLSIAKRIVRKPGKIVKVDQADYIAWEASKKMLAEAKEHEAECFGALLGQMGDAETGTCESGSVHYKLVQRKAYKVPAGSYRRRSVGPPEELPLLEDTQ